SVLAQTYVVGVENIEYYPYYSIDSEEVYVGYARDVLDTFAEEYNYTFEYQPLPLKRLFSDLVTQKIDFKFPDNPYWSADLKEGKNVVYSDSVVKFVDGAMVLPENLNSGVDKVDKLGAIMGFTPWPFLDLIEEGSIKTVETPNYSALLKQTTQGRVDAAYTNVSVGKYQLDKIFGDSELLVFDSDLPYDEASYLLSSAKHPDIIEEFNEFLKNNKKVLEDLQKQYNIGGLETIKK
ncbi:MAG: substrate-binding periplasmic protein, partial [archaeon]